MTDAELGRVLRGMRHEAAHKCRLCRASRQRRKANAALSGAEIAKQVREWASYIDSFYPITIDEMRAFADRLEAEPSSPTLAELVTPEQAGVLLRGMCDSGDLLFCEPCCARTHSRDYGQEAEPPAFAKLCHALWQRAKEGK